VLFDTPLRCACCLWRAPLAVTLSLVRLSGRHGVPGVLGVQCARWRSVGPCVFPVPCGWNIGSHTYSWLTYHNSHGNRPHMGSGVALSHRAEPNYKDARMCGYADARIRGWCDGIALGCGSVVAAAADERGWCSRARMSAIWCTDRCIGNRILGYGVWRRCCVSTTRVCCSIDHQGALQYRPLGRAARARVDPSDRCQSTAFARPCLSATVLQCDCASARSCQSATVPQRTFAYILKSLSDPRNHCRGTASALCDL
jgi:hypothetical protein